MAYAKLGEPMYANLYPYITATDQIYQIPALRRQPWLRVLPVSQYGSWSGVAERGSAAGASWPTTFKETGGVGENLRCRYAQDCPQGTSCKNGVCAREMCSSDAASSSGVCDNTPDFSPPYMSQMNTCQMDTDCGSGRCLNGPRYAPDPATGQFFCGRPRRTDLYSRVKREREHEHEHEHEAMSSYPQNTVLYDARTQYMENIVPAQTVSRTTEVVDFRDPIQVRGALARAETVCRRLSNNSPECFLARDVAEDASQSMVCWQNPGHPECREHLEGLSGKYGIDWTNMCGRGSFVQQPAVQRWLCSDNPARRTVFVEDAALPQRSDGQGQSQGQGQGQGQGQRTLYAVPRSSEEMFSDERAGEGGGVLLVVLVVAALLIYAAYRSTEKRWQDEV